MELGMRQRDLRKRFNLEKETYANWEKDRCYPTMKHWPPIISFLGYDPTPMPVTLGERILAYRRREGLSRKALAVSLNIDEATLWRWETDERKPHTKEHLEGIRVLTPR
jgi:transcriptional regulator with XRE-family HTH domain